MGAWTPPSHPSPPPQHSFCVRHWHRRSRGAEGEIASPPQNTLSTCAKFLYFFLPRTPLVRLTAATQGSGVLPRREPHPRQTPGYAYGHCRVEYEMMTTGQACNMCRSWAGRTDRVKTALVRRYGGCNAGRRVADRGKCLSAAAANSIRCCSSINGTARQVDRMSRSHLDDPPTNIHVCLWRHGDQTNNVTTCDYTRG